MHVRVTAAEQLFRGAIGQFQRLEFETLQNQAQLLANEVAVCLLSPSIPADPRNDVWLLEVLRMAMVAAFERVDHEDPDEDLFFLRCRFTQLKALAQRTRKLSPRNGRTIPVIPPKAEEWGHALIYEATDPPQHDRALKARRQVLTMDTPRAQLHEWARWKSGTYHDVEAKILLDTFADWLRTRRHVPGSAPLAPEAWNVIRRLLHIPHANPWSQRRTLGRIGFALAERGNRDALWYFNKAASVFADDRRAMTPLAALDDPLLRIEIELWSKGRTNADWPMIHDLYDVATEQFARVGFVRRLRALEAHWPSIAEDHGR